MFLRQSATGKNEIWRYLIGIACVMIMYVLGQLPLEMVKEVQISRHPDIGTAEEKLFLDTMDWSILHIDKNLGLILMLLLFVFGLIGMYLVTWLIHDKGFKDILTARPTFDYKRMLFGFGVWLVITLVLEGIFYLMNPNQYTLTFDPMRWFILLLISLTLLPIQTSWEEIFIRGYIMQGVFYHTRIPWLAMLVSSLIFAALHGANPEIAKYGYLTMGIYYIFAAMFLAYISIMDDGLELSMGVHWAINFVGATLLTYDGSVIQTDSIFRVSDLNAPLLIVGFIVAALIFSYIASRKYGWNSFGNLFEKGIIAENHADSAILSSISKSPSALDRDNDVDSND